jgi:hypothetical protein
MSGSYVALAVGINSLTGGGITDALGFGGGGGSRGGAAAQEAVDPFASYRGKLGEMYSGYLTGETETDITKMPGYSQFQKGVLNPALEASKRSSAASGILQSGNEQIALQDVGQRGYYGFMTDYLNRLAQGSGAVNNPAQAAGMGLNQMGMNQQGVMQGMGALGQIAGQFSGSNQGNVTYSGGAQDAQTADALRGYTNYQPSYDTAAPGMGG